MILTNSVDRFIVFEGLDGSGKSTQAKLLKEWLVNKNLKVILTSEPTDGIIGKIIREILSKKRKASSRTLELLFAADRADHLDYILEMLNAGYIVISDRYYFSALAYNSSDHNWLENVYQFMIDPEIIFFIDMPIENCIQRIQKRGADISICENKENLERAYKLYQKMLQNKKNVVYINGTSTIQEIHNEIINYMKNNLTLS